MWCSIHALRNRVCTTRQRCARWRRRWSRNRLRSAPIWSNGIARDFVYRELTATDNKKYCRLSSEYVAKANALARQRLVLAAWRLAALLNHTLGAEVPVKPPLSYPAGPPSLTW